MNTTLLIILLALIIAMTLVAYWIIDRPIRLEKMRIESTQQDEIQKVVTPLKLNAYERMILFLERSTPESMLAREMSHNMSCFDLQLHLLRVVREEFEHNLSQQIYISPQAWDAVVEAKTNIMHIINISSSQVEPKESAIKLAPIIIGMYNQTDETPTKYAIEVLKKEIYAITNI